MRCGQVGTARARASRRRHGGGLRAAGRLAAPGLAVLAVATSAGAGSHADVTAPPGLYAVFETSLGDIVCRLEHERTPVTVGNFVGLAEGAWDTRDPRTGASMRRRFYDGSSFHRVVPGFVVQGGDPTGDGRGDPGYTFANEFVTALRHDRAGVLSMADAGSDRNGSQFFITLSPAPFLDDRQTVFGHVVDGMDVVERVARQPLGVDARPLTPVVIEHVRIVRSGETARAFDAAAAFERRDSLRQSRDAQRAERQAAFQARVTQERARAVRSSSGLLFVVLQPGRGVPPRPGDTISAHLTGWLASDGTRFWSTHDQGLPFRVVVGQKRVIPAWEETYLAMRPGEKRFLIVPPELGWGEAGNPGAGVPAGASLVFEIELLAVEHP
jgi:peptidylprolyl isomerase